MIADVADNPGGASLPEARQSNDCLINLTPFARADAYIDALTHQRFRDGPAYALRPTRYDCRFVFEIHRSLWSKVASGAQCHRLQSVISSQPGSDNDLSNSNGNTD